MDVNQTLLIARAVHCFTRQAERSWLGIDQTRRCSFRATSPRQGIPTVGLVCILVAKDENDLRLL